MTNRSDERKRPPKDWEGVVDKAIREAIERGEFKNLPGSGKPLDLEGNPFTPTDMQLAYKVLRDAGVSLDWIEEDKEIRAEIRSVSCILERAAATLRLRAEKERNLAPDQMIAEHAEIARLRVETCERFRNLAGNLNRRIDTHNLKVPTSRLQHRRIGIEGCIERFLSASRPRG